MRILSAVIAIAIMSSQTGAIAAPRLGSPEAVQAPSAFDLVKKHKHRGKHKKSDGVRGYAAPGHCGTFKYYKKGKCLNATDKKDKK